MYNRSFPFIAAIPCCLVLAASLSGCGGGSSNGSGQTASQTRTGRVQLNISWPAKSDTRAKSRYIPTYAASLFCELFPKGNPNQRYNVTANRPSDKPAVQQVTFQDLLPAGTYELACQANALPDGQGAAVASGALEIEVKSGMNPVSLTLNSTIKTLLVLGQPLKAATGQSVTLQSGAFDPNGAGLLLPDGALTWSIVSGSQFGSITPGGKLTTTAAGTIKVHVEEPVTKVFAEADVTVSVQGSTTGLAQSGYPKTGSDLASSGLVQGSGATGTFAWSFDMGQRGVGTPVLGTNNLLFAINQNGAIFALNATTGAKIWQKQSLGTTLLNASLVAGDDNTLFVGTSAGVEAYDMATGLQKWTNTDYNVNANMTLISGKLYVPTSSFGMAVIDSRTGASLTPLPGASGSTVYTYDGAIANGIIYYVSESLNAPRAATLFAVNLGTSATVWTKNIPSSQQGSGYNGSYPVIAPDGTVYIEFGDGNISAFDGLSGAPKFTQTAIATAGKLQPAIGKDNSVTFVRLDTNGGGQKEVRYDALLNTLVWSASQVLAEPTVGADGTVYGSGVDATNQGQTTLFALNNSDGSVKWKVPLDKGVNVASPGFGTVPGFTAVGPTGMIYVVSIDHLVYAIK